MPRLLYQPPKYRLHKGSGQAIVSLAGRKVYLGKYGSPRSHELYEEAIAQWRRSLVKHAPARADADDDPVVTPASLRDKRAAGVPVSLNELILVYHRHAHQYYRKHGKVTREAEIIDEVLRFLRQHHGREAVHAFGPVTLDGLRDKMIDDLDWSRKHINKQVSRLVRMFKWGVEHELIDSEAHSALAKLTGLKKGRSRARETHGVACVADDVVDQTLAQLPEVVADMVRLQRLTGARPGEICSLRPADIDRSHDVWVYLPAEHKTEHHEQPRAVMIGPRAQAVLAPYLLRAAGDYCFTPHESERRRRTRQAAARKTPLRKRDRDRMKLDSIRRYAEHYTADTYRHAVQRVCTRLKLPKWSPNQLRHTAATDIRRRFGLEAAQVVCGHQSADVTQVYAERDHDLAKRVAREVG